MVILYHMVFKTTYNRVPSPWFDIIRQVLTCSDIVRQMKAFLCESFHKTQFPPFVNIFPKVFPRPPLILSHSGASETLFLVGGYTNTSNPLKTVSVGFDQFFNFFRFIYWLFSVSMVEIRLPKIPQKFQKVKEILKIF